MENRNKSDEKFVKFAMRILQHIDKDKFLGLKIGEKPDLQDNDTSIGVEVTLVCAKDIECLLGKKEIGCKKGKEIENCEKYQNGKEIENCEKYQNGKKYEKCEKCEDSEIHYGIDRNIVTKFNNLFGELIIKNVFKKQKNLLEDSYIAYCDDDGNLKEACDYINKHKNKKFRDILSKEFKKIVIKERIFENIPELKQIDYTLVHTERYICDINKKFEEMIEKEFSINRVVSKARNEELKKMQEEEIGIAREIFENIKKFRIEESKECEIVRKIFNTIKKNIRIRHHSFSIVNGVDKFLGFYLLRTEKRLEEKLKNFKNYINNKERNKELKECYLFIIWKDAGIVLPPQKTEEYKKKIETALKDLFQIKNKKFPAIFTRISSGNVIKFSQDECEWFTYPKELEEVEEEEI